MSIGKLYLIPTFLSDKTSIDLLPVYNINIILDLDEFIVEEIKTARRFLRSIGYLKDFNSVVFYELNEHTELSETENYLNSIVDKGKSIGLLSEAGTPCIADPGSELVILAHHKNIQVIPLPGSNSIFLALMASGLNGQRFLFHGYLPIDKLDRKLKLKEMEGDAKKTGRTQICIETPYRNLQFFEAIISICHPDLMLCVACNINSNDEFIRTKSIGSWKGNTPDIHKKPAVFLMNF
jgi:16S rRNA (cytidine1402-2'-O)-methyltransferase